MDMETIRAELATLLEVPVGELTDDAPLHQFGNWDSLAMVALIAYLVSGGQPSVNVDRLEKLATVGEIRALLAPACAEAAR
ncbi:acyl carrier protein [Burkholderia sp. FERM BP-3421]|jgi:acyl carrier protein|uniref:acyl carrier protein n=1 Tax=Burkholderia sp. FERM BP-3421 TaxID=1494466 RepID=UPI00235DD5BE|nr:acyl carrier protein [Burkholderia sp. FERM BP-3421]WDD91537.1 acyl carrier protein [Burkholderia sp. FERM BP-3421]